MKLLVAAGMLALVTFARAEDTKPTDSLQGEWKVVSVTLAGMDMPKEEAQKMTFVIEGDKITIKGGAKDGDMTFVLDPKAKPATIDLTLKETGQDVTIPGIYKVEKDALTICAEFNSAGKRPKEFESKDGSRSLLFVFERVKK